MYTRNIKQFLVNIQLRRSFEKMRAVKGHIKKILLITLSIIVLIFRSDFYNQPSPLLSKSCGRFPQEKDILIDNFVWQVLETSAGFIKLFSAYLDARWNQTHIKILASGPCILTLKNVEIFCQIWFEDDLSKPLIVIASQPDAIRPQRKEVT